MTFLQHLSKQIHHKSDAVAVHYGNTPGLEIKSHLSVSALCSYMRMPGTYCAMREQCDGLWWVGVSLRGQCFNCSALAAKMSRIAQCQVCVHSISGENCNMQMKGICFPD